MKKIIALLMVLFVVFSSSFASANAKSDKTPTGIIQAQNVTIALGDITNRTDCEVAEAISELTNSCLTTPNKVLQCSITVGASIHIGPAYISISVTVSGDCSEIRTEGEKIAKEILEEIKRYIKHNLE